MVMPAVGFRTICQVHIHYIETLLGCKCSQFHQSHQGSQASHHTAIFHQCNVKRMLSVFREVAMLYICNQIRCFGKKMKEDNHLKKIHARVKKIRILLIIKQIFDRLDDRVVSQLRHTCRCRYLSLTSCRISLTSSVRQSYIRASTACHFCLCFFHVISGTNLVVLPCTIGSLWNFSSMKFLEWSHMPGVREV